MELIDTPNPNAKKIETDVQNDSIKKNLDKIENIDSVFYGPGFITITKKENIEWESISRDITNIFDKL
tara:strand:- start:174 stop:377 length:204 start_codon:yes stop_codon:yes gene_type:complete